MKQRDETETDRNKDRETETETDLEDGAALVAGHAGGRVALKVLNVGIRARLQQQAANVCLVLGCGLVQRRETPVVLHRQGKKKANQKKEKKR